MLQRHISFLIIGIVGLMLLVSAPGRAEENSVPSQEEVVITAPRSPQTNDQTPGKTEVITGEQIVESGAATVSEALLAQGVIVSSNADQSGPAQVQLEGSASTQSLVLMNGVPVNTGGVGFIDWRNIPTTSIKRIEVTHGPLSALYGSNTAGGVVNIITDLTGETGSRFHVNGGSFGALGADYEYRQEKWGIAAGLATNGGYRNYSASNSNYLLGQYNLSTSGDEYMKLYWQYLTTYRQFQNSLTTNEEHQGEQNLNVNLNGASYLWDVLWNYKVYAQYLDNWHDNNISVIDYKTTSYGVDVAGSYILNNHELTPGFSIHQSQLETPNTQSNDFALFIQDSTQLTDRLQLIAGLRQDLYSAYSAPLSPRVSLINNINDQVAVKIGYEKTFRVPTFEEKYWVGDAFSGNPGLKPESGDRYDIIGEWKKDDQSSFIVDIYQSNLNDGIIWRGAGYTPENKDKVRVQGADLSWQNIWTDRITSKISYNIMDKKGADSGSELYTDDLNYFGKQQLNLGLNYKYQAWLCNVNWLFVNGRSNGADYNVLNLNVNYLLNQKLSFVLSVDNLGDQDYEVNSGYSMPERGVTLKANYSF